jgi:hypothetical protein
MRRIAAMAETYDGRSDHSLMLDLSCSLSNNSRYCATLSTWSKCLLPSLHCGTNNSLQPIALAACLQIGLCTPNHMIQEMSMGKTISLSIHFVYADNSRYAL